MARATQTSPVSEGVQALLADPRFEVLPFKSFDDQITHLPEGATITITASPTLELESTLEKSELAAERGFEVVPHLAARYVRDVDQLESIVDRLFGNRRLMERRAGNRPSPDFWETDW